MRITAVVLVAALLVCAYQFGILARFREPQALAHELVALGWVGYLAFVLAYTVLQPFGVPGTVFIMAAPLIWPWPVAFALSMVGTMTASVVGFSFARFVARDWVSKLIPARFRKYEEALARRAFLTVFVLRIVFWMPPLLHAFFGVSKVRFWTHFWGSFLGYLLPLFLVSYFGQGLFDMMWNAPLEAWIATGLGMAAIAIGVWVVRRFAVRRSADAERVEAIGADQHQPVRDDG